MKGLFCDITSLSGSSTESLGGLSVSIWTSLSVFSIIFWTAVSSSSDFFWFYYFVHNLTQTHFTEGTD